MNNNQHLAGGRSDAELIQLTRDGDTAAFGELYEKYYEDALRSARRLSYSHSFSAEDLVSESFTRLLDIIRRGSGPTEKFLPYLNQVIRNEAYSLTSGESSMSNVDDLDNVLVADEGKNVDLTGPDGDTIRQAFASLPERWREVLWLSEVEEQKPSEFCAKFDLSPNSASALLLRAREAFKTAYLQAHVPTIRSSSCMPTVTKLGAYVSGSISRRDKEKSKLHLDSCPHCSGAVRELSGLTMSLRASIGPLLLAAGVGGSIIGAAAAGAGAGTVAASAATSKSAGLVFIEGVKSAASAATASTTATVSTIAASVALVAVAAGTVLALALPASPSEAESAPIYSAPSPAGVAVDPTPTPSPTLTPEPTVEPVVIPTEIPSPAPVEPTPTPTPTPQPDIEVPSICVDYWSEISMSVNDRLIVRRAYGNGSFGEPLGANWYVTTASGSLLSFDQPDILNLCGPFWSTW